MTDAAVWQPFKPAVLRSPSLAAIGQSDVLFVYGRLAATGEIVGMDVALRQVVARARAKIVVVGLENPTAAYIADGKQRTVAPTNMIMTLERRGPIFAAFMRDFFGSIMGGTSMLNAWREVCSARGDSQSPSTIFSCEIGDLQFGAR